MSYDYTGYGCSSGKPSVAATCADIEAVYRYTVETLGVDPASVILYGQSVGSGPTVGSGQAGCLAWPGRCHGGLGAVMRW
jgi:hypothetical protein